MGNKSRSTVQPVKKTSEQTKRTDDNSRAYDTATEIKRSDVEHRHFTDKMTDL